MEGTGPGEVVEIKFVGLAGSGLCDSFHEDSSLDIVLHVGDILHQEQLIYLVPDTSDNLVLTLRPLHAGSVISPGSSLAQSSYSAVMSHSHHRLEHFHRRSLSGHIYTLGRRRLSISFRALSF